LPKTKDNSSASGSYNAFSITDCATSLISKQVDLSCTGDTLLRLQPVNVDRRSAVPSRSERAANNPFNLLLDSQEAEKKRISRELHDSLGQLLTSINLHALQCLSNMDTAVEIPQAMRDSLQVISAMTKQAMGELRGICGALRPAILDDLGVEAAINWQCRQISSGAEELRVTTDFQIHEALIPDAYRTVIYRIVQEALNNAVKYARADSISIKLYHAGDFLQLIIEDDGIGFDPRQVVAGDGMGLTSMRERSAAVGGLFELQSGIGTGVEIRVLLPLEKAALSG
jgi:signal transduction histidine kinase